MSPSFELRTPACGACISRRRPLEIRIVSGVQFIRDFAVVMVIAGGAAWLCQRLRLSAVVGYLVAGAVLGPFTPPFALIADLDRVQTLAQLGLIFLVFFIGLNLSLSRLKRLGLSLIAATAISAVLILSLCRLLGGVLGWGTTAALFLAAMILVSSSAVIGKVLEELNLTHERPGQLALGMTVLEDVVAVAMLTLLTSVVQFGAGQRPSLLPTLGGLGAFVVFLALISLLFAPNLLVRLSRSARPEVQTLVVVGALLSLAWLTALAGYSPALGAFVFGAIVGSTRFRDAVERNLGGLQQVFGAVFFVAIGMQVDFRLVLAHWPLVLGITALALLLRPIACTLGLVAVGNGLRESIAAGLSLVPLGEFSFIIAQLGVTTGAVTPGFYPAAVAAALLTALAAPWLVRRGEAAAQRLERAQPRFLRGWVEFYHNWLTRLRSLRSANLIWRLTRRPLVQILVHVAAVSAMILLANPVYQQARDLLGRHWLAPGALPFAFWTAFGLLLLGPLIAVWRNVSVIAMILAENATQGSARQKRLRPLLEAALRVVAFLILLAWLFALLPSGWSLLGVAGGVLLLLLIVGVVFWRRFVRLHSRLEFELSEQLRRASHATAKSAWSHTLPAPSADWNLDLDEVELPSDSVHAGTTLGQLALRQRFGCSIVGIDRQGFGIANPGATTVLYPGDRLLLLGTAEQLARAARHLGDTSPPSAGPTDFDEMTMESVVVPPRSPLAGRQLSELDLIHRVGVQIGGIRRGVERRLTLSGRDRLECGDELLVLGTHAQIKEFYALLTPPG